MAVDYSTYQFPSHIDRDIFGAWFSGFADGEGSFILRCTWSKQNKCICRNCQFSLTLRSDDASVIRLIKAFFNVGVIYYNSHHSHNQSTTKPVCRYCVGKMKDIKDVIIPHFEKYPLFAKKSRDFLIFKEAFALFYLVAQRGNRGQPGKVGRSVNWTQTESDRFQSYADALRTQRKYEAELIELPTELSRVSLQKSLF